jgi:hypothetical protein
MYQLCIHAQSYGRVFEVLPEEVESTELIIEEIVSLALLDLFDEAMVDEVTAHFSPASSMGQRDCSIMIQAQCSLQTFKLLPCTKECMEFAVKERVCSLLKQLFGAVTIESVTVQPFFMESR